MKKSNTNPIDELIFNQFSNFEPEVPERIWESISKDLNTQKNSSVKFYFIRIAIAAIVLFSIGTFFYYFNTPAPVSSPMISKSEPAKMIRIEEITPQSKEIASINLIKPSKKEMRTPVVLSPPQIISNVQVVEPIKPIAEVTSEITPEVIEYKEMPLITTISPEKRIVKNKKTIELNSVANVLQTLVNRIDKREEKIIDIKRAENGKGTESLSINLGLIKIKRTSSIN